MPALMSRAFSSRLPSASSSTSASRIAAPIATCSSIRGWCKGIVDTLLALISKTYCRLRATQALICSAESSSKETRMSAGPSESST